MHTITIALLSCVCAHAATLDGKVVNEVTGEPIRGVSVSLAPHSTTTDDKGTFSIKDVAPGTYRLTFTNPGYMPAQHGAKSPGRPGTPIVITADQAQNPLTIRMRPFAVLSGTVVDETGDPLSFADVAAMRFEYRGGVRQVSPSGNATTDDQGNFRMFRLNSGQYLLRVTPPASASQYLPVYYPATTNIDAAATISLSAGQQVSGMRLAFTPTKALRIRATISNPPGVTGQPFASLIPQGSAYSIGRMGILGVNQGQFESRTVAPGRYTIIAGVGDGEKCYSGTADVDATDKDPPEPKIELTSGGELTGRVVIEDDANKLDPTKLQLSLRATGREAGTRMNGQKLCLGTDSDTKPDTEGRFTFTGVMADNPTLVVTGLPNGYYVKSGFSVIPNSQLRIVVSGAAATASGTVSIPGAQIVLIPRQQDRHGQAAYYRTALADAAGRFTLNSIPPEDYKAYAWNDVEPTAWLDDEFMKPFESKATSITIAPGSNQQLQLAVID
jgi:hypothetical protein